MLNAVDDTITLIAKLLYSTLYVDPASKRCVPHTDGIIQRIFLFQGVTNNLIVWNKMFINRSPFTNNRIGCHITCWTKYRFPVYNMIEIYLTIDSYIGESITVEIIKIGSCLVLILWMGIGNSNRSTKFICNTNFNSSICIKRTTDTITFRERVYSWYQ